MPSAPSLRFEPQHPGAQGFWEAAADTLRAWLQPAGGRVHRPSVLVVARASQIEPLRRALQARIAAPGHAWAPPPIRTLAQWLDERVPSPPVDPWARALCLLGQLDEAMADGIPRAAAERLDLAARLLVVLDAWSVWRDTQALPEARQSAHLVQAFASPLAQSHVEQDLDLIERLAHALRNAGFDPATEAVGRLQRLVQRWASEQVRVAWFGWQALDPFESHLREQLEARLPADDLLSIEPDWRAVYAQAPLLAMAWPEGWGQTPLKTLASRRQAWLDRPSGSRPDVLHVYGREREAQAGAAWVHARLVEARDLGMPPPRLAIIALDRWLARRVRALLERAGVLIDDRQGWLLSTTVASTSVMAWLDLVAGEGRRADLLTWIDGPFLRPSDVAPIRAWIDSRAARGEPRGWDGWLTPDTDGRAPPENLRALHAHARAQSRPQSLQAHLTCLARLFSVSGVDRALAGDEAGRQVLAALESLRRSVDRAPDPRPIAVAELRALLAQFFEHRRFVRAIDSPIQILSLEEAAGRSFDAALLLGASAQALPSRPGSLPLVNEAVRERLGLPTASSLARVQQRDLAVLMTCCPRVAITCRTDAQEGSHPSPWVERLWLVGEGSPLALLNSEPRSIRTLQAVPVRRRASVLGRLPDTLSVSAIEHLVACPFRFLVSDGWRLRVPNEPSIVPGARERGSQAHFILERFHSEMASQGVPFEPAFRPSLKRRLSEITDEVVAQANAHQVGLFAESLQWRLLIDPYLDWALAEAVNGWRFLAAEAEAEVKVEWGHGSGRGAVRIVGRLDRIDQGQDGLRVIDYKFGSPVPLKVRSKDPLQAAQLVLYAWMATGDTPVIDTAYLSMHGSKDGSSVEYIGLAGGPAEAVERWRERLPSTLARIDAGEPLAALGADCDRCPARGVCRRGHWS